MRQAHIRHFDPFDVAQGRLREKSRGVHALSRALRKGKRSSSGIRTSHELKIRSMSAVAREVARAIATSAPDSEITLK